MHTGSDIKTTEIYLMPGIGANSHATFSPPPGRIDYSMGNEMTSEYVIDQGLCYPTASSYGYYFTGFEPPGEWGEYQQPFGLDGQNLHYSGFQNEILPYIYYTPSYGYAHSSQDQYGPYVPGAVMGLDGSFIGTQPFIGNPAYQPVSPPAYVPVFVQSANGLGPYSSENPLSGTVATTASRSSNIGIKSAPQPSVNATAASQLAASITPLPEASRSYHQNQRKTKSSEGSGVGLPQSHSLSHGAKDAVTASLRNQGGSSSDPRKATDGLSHGRASFHNPLKIGAPSNSSFTNFVSSDSGWDAGEKFQSGFQFQRVAMNGNRNPNILTEQNTGPRTSRSKGLTTSVGANRADQKVAGSDPVAEGNIIIRADQYNMNDFPVDYPDAKFYVIKSYSEDDVHKSIKYNVWSSTSSGNRRLDIAYEDAKRKSVGKPRNCPIFLFFSVNTSGQFCGVAEMVGPVDFDKDMDFWQQDKWSGSFPVKWHFIKDVANASFRHILLENNENKPVTNSRDTQEIPYSAGISMLKIFKSTSSTTSVLDDFLFYEERQKLMLEDKCRRLGRNFDAYLYVPAIVTTTKDDEPGKVDENQSSGKEDSPEKVGELDNGLLEQDYEINKHGNSQTPKDDRKQSSIAAKQIPNADGEQLGSTAAAEGCSAAAAEGCSAAAADQPSKAAQKFPADALGLPSKLDREKMIAIDQPLQAYKKQSNQVNEHPKADGNLLKSKVMQHPTLENSFKPTETNSPGKASHGDKQSTKKLDALVSSHGDVEAATSIMKSRLPADSTRTKAKSFGKTAVVTTPIDIVKVGSLHIQVNGMVGESSSTIVSVGSSPVESGGTQLNKQRITTEGHLPKKGH
ncbi:uncharacterized protein [Typha angustifolia]|uniref:uncharacterized protein isoform X2 n=1 Tax=Typha angustifolia TaxID=59011 RepID=UPI003C2BE73D